MRPTLNDRPTTIIDFSSNESPFGEVWPSTHRATLPVVGQALIVRLIQQLVAQGIRHVRVARSTQQHAVRQRLGSGAEWGITIRYSDLHGPEVRQQALLEDQRCLYFYADTLQYLDLAALLATEQRVRRDPLAGYCGAGLWTLEADGHFLRPLPALRRDLAKHAGISSAASFHSISQYLASRPLPGMVLPGGSLRTGVRVDWDSEVSDRAILGDRAFVGKHCLVSAGVRLHGDVVVNNGCVLMNDVQLQNVTVLPNTFIGPGVRLRDAVVTPVGLCDLQGRFWPIDDDSAIGRTRHNDELCTGLPDERLSVVEQRLRA